MKVLPSVALLSLLTVGSTLGVEAQEEHMEGSMHAEHHASPEDHAAVMATVEQLFDGMRANDSEMVLDAFHPDAVLISTERGRTGEAAPSLSSIGGFAEAVGNSDQAWDEPIWDEIVHVQDHLASVWVKYAFYLGGTEFSHCGVDAFILARDEEGAWKILALADSRQFEDCEMPPGRG